MANIFLHEQKDFERFIRTVSKELNIKSFLIEKDYWIMHCLYCMKKQGLSFQMKGGTSLSKGFGIIHRFSEDIDIHIDPPKELAINENPNNHSADNSQKKKMFYDFLAGELQIPGLLSIERYYDYDDTHRYNNGGIRLLYPRISGSTESLKEGVLLEVGFDNVAPNMPVTISSWVYDRVKDVPGVPLIDNRAVDIACYDPCYTLVEKLQAIVTKFRKEMETGMFATNYMRQYYDVYCLLGEQSVVDFIGSEAYQQHKLKRFSKMDFGIPMEQNEAFLMTDPEMMARLRGRYTSSASLYYKGQPPFEELLDRIRQYLPRM